MVKKSKTPWLARRRGLCTVLKNFTSTEWVKRYSSTKSLSRFFSRTFNFKKVFLTGFSAVMILYFHIRVLAHFRNLAIFYRKKSANSIFQKTVNSVLPGIE